MAYLLVGDMDTHIYSENRDEIVRSDNTLVYGAIDAAVAEAKSYLGRFDLLALFGDAESDPSFEDANLKNKVKDLALWHLVTLGQANIKIELARSRYEDAVRWFEKVADRKISPGFPKPEDKADTDSNEGKGIEWDSLPRRNNHV
ncbi:MAG: phage protein Gp36 family protein [Bacteroidota bacterium]